MRIWAQCETGNENGARTGVLVRIAGSHAELGQLVLMIEEARKTPNTMLTLELPAGGLQVGCVDAPRIVIPRVPG